MDENKKKYEKRKKPSSDQYWRPQNSSNSGNSVNSDDTRFSENGKKNKNEERNDMKRHGGYNSGPERGLKTPNGRFSFFAIITLSLIFFSYFFSSRTNVAQISYTKFKNLVQNSRIVSVDIKDSAIIEFKTKEGDEGQTRIPYADLSLLSELEKYSVEVKGSERSISIWSVIVQFLPYVFFIGLMLMIVRSVSASGQLNQFGHSLAKQFNEKDVKIKFKDVAGQKEAKYELEEVVQFLKNPNEFNEIGAKIPRGILLVGPPGTGKTLIAKAVAGEAGVSFFHTSGSDFVEMFVGMGAARVRDLFDQGRKHAPCILFIDEIDAVGRSRGSGLGGGHDEREQTLNQILVEMDGFETGTGVIVIAATNRADVLDPALLRPGRFDRRVSITLPDIEEREEILKIHASKVKMDNSIDLRKIARATPGASGADLANLVNEAALYATRNKRKKISIEDFENARDKMVLGIAKRSHVITPEDKRLTAYHEAGHALLFYYLPDIDPLYKVTIIPHGDAGGVTMGLPEQDVSYMKKSALLSHIKMSMGGYVAEEIINGQTSTSPSSDIKQATEIARRMVTEWGMSSLGFISLGSEGEPLFLGREIAQHKDFSEDTAKKIDKEILQILDTCLKETRSILTEHKDQLDKLANALIERETLDDSDVRELLAFEKIASKNSDLT